MSAAALVLIVKVSLVLAAALAAAWAARGANARARHLLWSGVFAAVLLLPLVALAVPDMPVPIPTWVAQADEPAPRLQGETLSVIRDPRPAERADVTVPAPEASQTSSSPEASKSPVPWPSLSTMLAALWIGGALAALLSLVAALWRVRRLANTATPLDDSEWRASTAALGARLGVRGTVRLLASAHVSTPMAGGILAPTIYLPPAAAEWSADRRDVVLAHEIAHLACRDPLRQVLTRVALAAYWFHPLAWIAARQSAVAREQACDEAVLALGTRPSTYARVLLDFADAPRVSAIGLAALPIVQRSHLEKRLMAILNENARPSARRIALIPAALAALTLSVAAAQPAQVGSVEQTASGVPLSGVSGGVTGGVAGGVVSGATGGVVSGATGGVVSGAIGGVVSGATGGVVRGATGGVVSGAIGGVFSGSLGGVASGVLQGQGGSACYLDTLSGFSGSLNIRETAGRQTIQEAVGRRQADYVIVKNFGELRVCALAEALPRDEQLQPSQWAGAARRVVFETQEGRDVRRMEIEGSRVSWSVNGQSRPVDAAATEWRARLVVLLDPLWQLSRLRGEVSSLRGQISSIHGQRSSLRGEISSLRGQVSSMRGEISSWRGHESSLRGQISSIRGHLSSLNGRISSERGAISSLEASRWDASEQERARVAERVKVHLERIKRIEDEIAKYDADAKIREVQKRIEEIAVDRKVAEVEKRLGGFDVDQRVADVEKRIAELEVDKRVAEIERTITSLEADRRSRDLEAQIEAALTRLRAIR